MNFSAVVGIILGFAGVIYGYLADEGALSALIKLPSISIVIGGTLGIMVASNPVSRLKKIPKALRLVFLEKRQDMGALIQTIIQISIIARKSGLLALESQAVKYDNPILKKGLTYIADGVPPERLRLNLEAEALVFEGMGGTSPTMGVLGTVMGMVSILRDMGTDMDALGGKIATAFIATMYGVGFANLVYLPLASHIRAAAEEEYHYYRIMIEGLVAIQAGEYPARIQEYLLALSGPSNVRKIAAAKK